MAAVRKIGFGGGCHWCTEAVFQQVDGVVNVEQGWIASTNPNDSFSEAVIVHYNPNSVELDHLIKVHLHTHSATSNHPMRSKYRSAVYHFDDDAKDNSLKYLENLKSENIITKVLPFVKFKKNEETYLDYYRKNPDSPFCKRYIQPKLERLNSLRSL